MTKEFDATRAAIASKLRAARSAARLTLDELAARSGVSKGSLVNLEQGQGNPSVGVLCQVAVALGISLADLVNHSAPASPIMFTLEGGRVMWQGERGGSARMVVGTLGPEMLELWEWELFPTERYQASAHSPGTRELLLPITGTLGVAVGAWQGTIIAGQGMLVTTDVEHSYWCAGSEPVRFQMIVSESPSR